MLLYKGKYRKLFSFALLFKKLSLNKQKMWDFWFSGFPSSLLKCSKLFNIKFRKFCFPKFEKLFYSGFLHVLRWKNYFLKYKIEVFLKYKEMFRVSRFPNIRKAFLWENIINFLILEQKGFVSQNIRKIKNFYRGFFF